jgi:hypothetical protein
MQRYNIKIFAGEKMGKITHSYKKTLPLNPLPPGFSVPEKNCRNLV